MGPGPDCGVTRQGARSCGVWDPLPGTVAAVQCGPLWVPRAGYPPGMLWGHACGPGLLSALPRAGPW